MQRQNSHEFEIRQKRHTAVTSFPFRYYNLLSSIIKYSEIGHQTLLRYEIKIVLLPCKDLL